MKVHTRPVEMEAWQVRSICAWYQRRQLQGMPEPIAKAFRNAQLEFLGDRLRLRMLDGNVLADLEDVIVAHPRGQLERMPLHVFEARFTVEAEEKS